MRILFVTPVIPSETDGRRPYNFLRYLAKRHQVHVLAIQLPVQTMDDTVRIAKLGANAKAFRPGGVTSAFLSVFRGEPLRVGWCRSSGLRAMLREFVQKHSVDVVHFDRMRMGQYAINLPGIPKLIDFTDSMALYLERSMPYRISFLDRIVDGYDLATIPRHETKILEHVNLGLLCSDVDLARFQQDHPSAPIEIIQNGVNTEEFVPQTRGDVALPRCIITGSLFYFPNIDAIRYYEQEIWPRVRMRVRGIKTEIIGARPTPEINSLNDKLGLIVKANVKRMSDQLYQEDVYVCPLRVGAGMRNKLLEAMAAGMAVVTSPLGCEGLGVRHNEHVIVAENPAQFAEAIVQLVNNPEFRTKLGMQARQYVEQNHHLDIIGEKLEQAYARIIAEGPIQPPVKNGNQGTK
ncbi:MAG TPA: glycosyltransferase family 4 protein [bacterium]|nr:glycosyltransferase family 4 protein [bacterium]HQP97616.1 glycosyltransferase family 4 protein [bacterium]